MDLALDDVIGSMQDALERSLLGSENHKGELEAGASLAQQPQLSRLLQARHDDVRSAAELAGQSYLHPLGFHKLMLLKHPPLFEVRINVWRPGGIRGVDHVHNHRFAFASTIVRGGYDMQTFQAGRTGALVREYRETASPEAGWLLHPQGTAHLRMMSSTRLEQGSSYALPADVLHRVAVPPDILCITLLLRTALAGSETSVFAGPENAIPTTIPVQPMSSREYRRQISALLTEIEC
jgi:hypothetical protein